MTFLAHRLVMDFQDLDRLLLIPAHESPATLQHTYPPGMLAYFIHPLPIVIIIAQHQTSRNMTVCFMIIVMHVGLFWLRH